MSDLLPTKKEIKREARIELSKRSFWKFCQTIASSFYTDERTHLKTICDSLQAIYEGRIGRDKNGFWKALSCQQKNSCKKIMINIPPQHGKTRTLINFSNWVFGKNVSEKIITCSYNDTTASDFSRYSRDGITMLNNSDDDINYSDIFPSTKIKQGNSSFEKWALQGQHFSYLGAGIGGSITGKGATILIVDDPVKSAEDALNENNLERIWLWYTSTFSSRVSAEKGEPIEIICMTRWSNRDICGKILGSSESKDWFVLKMKAYDEATNEMLCPSLLSKERYDTQKKRVLASIFNSNYLQEPTENKGVLFHKKDLKRFSLKEHRKIAAERKEFNKLGYWDVADTGVDHLAAAIGDIQENKIMVTDVIFNNEGVGVTKPMTIALLIKEKPQYIRIESNNQGGVFAQWIRPDCPLTSVQTIANTTNKLTRILMQEQFVKDYFYFCSEEEIVEGSDYDLFVQQLCSYTRDGSIKKDDAPDCITGLAQMVRGFLPHLFTVK